jgi:hypothetical protein
MSLNGLWNSENKKATILEEIENISHIEKLFSYINEKMKSTEHSDKEKKQIIKIYKKRLSELCTTFKWSSTIDQEKIHKLENIFTNFPINTWIESWQHDMFWGQETKDLINKYIPEDKKELFVKILSITSIRTNTASNIDLTFRIYINHLKWVKTPKLFGNVNEQIKTVLDGWQISWSKITNFQNSILWDQNAVVIDSHIAKKMFNVWWQKEQEDGKKLQAWLKPIEYLYCELIVREIALEKWFTPNQVSCILQYTGRTENNSKYNTSYYQYFEEKIVSQYNRLKKYNGIHTEIEKKPWTADQIKEILVSDKNFEVLFGQWSWREKSDIIIKNNEGKAQSLLDFCREQWHSPYFAPGDNFAMRTMSPLGSPKEIIYDKKEMDEQWGILSFLHELGECIRYKKETAQQNKIDTLNLSAKERNMEYEKLTLKRQIESRYLAIKFGKEFQKRWFNVFYGFSTIKDLEYYINKFVVTYMEKIHYALEKKDCLVDSQKIVETMTSQTPMKTR